MTKPPHLRDWGVCAQGSGPTLAVCGDSCMVVEHASIMHLSFAQQKLRKINHFIFVRKS